MKMKGFVVTVMVIRIWHFSDAAAAPAKQVGQAV